jgi:hypothetical protein
MAQALAPATTSQRTFPLIPAVLAFCTDARLVVAVLTICGAGLRLLNLGLKPLWFDEAVLWIIAQNHNLGAVITENAIANSAPPLFALMLHVVNQFNSTPEALRMIPVLASVSTIPSIYFLSTTMWPNRYAGYAAAALMAFGPNQIEYAQQVREYSLTILLALLLLLFAFRVAMSLQLREIILFTVIEMIAIATQYGLVLVIVVSLLAIGAQTYQKKEWSTLKLLSTLQLAPAAIALLVLLTTTRYQMQAGGFESGGYLADGYWEHHSIHSLVNLAVAQTYHLIGFSLTDGTLTSMVGVLCIALGLLVAWRLNMSRLLLVILLGPVMLTFVLALFQVYPYVAARQDIYLTVPAILLTGWGLVMIFTWRPQSYAATKNTVFALLLLVGLLYPLARNARAYLRSGGAEDITQPLAVFSHQHQRNDWLYVSSDALPAFVYVQCHAASCPAAFLTAANSSVLGRPIPVTSNGPIILGGSPVGAVPALRYDTAQVNAIVHRGHRIWYLFSHYEAASDAILSPARKQGRVELMSRVQGASVYLFSPRK